MNSIETMKTNLITTLKEDFERIYSLQEEIHAINNRIQKLTDNMTYSYAANRLLNFDNETQKKFDALLLYLKNRPEYPLLEYEISWHRTPKYFLTDVLKAVEFILQILLKNLDNEMSYEERADIKNYWDSLVFEIWRKI